MIVQLVVLVLEIPPLFVVVVLPEAQLPWAAALFVVFCMISVYVNAEEPLVLVQVHV